MPRFSLSLKHILLGFVCSLAVTTASVFACTRAMWVNDQAVVVARTMDWNGDMKSNLFVLPRGMEREGLADVNSLNWTSKYGSIMTAAYDAISTDGVNEKGLAAHIFWLVESDYGKRDPSLPAISILMWEQFYLDNFASVDEAVSYTQAHPFQLEPFELDQPMTLHLIINDASGDAAIFEYIDGKLHIYHGREFTVTANSPSFDKHLENLRAYKGFGGDKSLPGTTDSTDRFVRAAYYANHLPEPSSSRDAITKILSVINNTAMPYGTSSAERPVPSETIWETAIDLTHHIYYFESTTNRNLLWANLDKFDLNPGAPVLKLDLVRRTHLSGDVTDKFVPVDMLDQPKSIKLRMRVKQ